MLTRQKFLTDTFLYGLAQSLIGLRDLIILPVFAGFLNAESYGLFTQVVITVTLLVPLATFRLEMATIRFLATESVNSNRFSRYFYSGLVWSFGAGTLAALLLVLFASVNAQLILGNVAYSEFMIFTALLLITTVFGQYLQNYFRIAQQITLLSAILLGQSFLEIIVILVIVSLGHGIKGAIGGLIIIRAAFGLGLWGLVRGHTGRLELSWANLREMLGYSMPLMPNILTLWAVDYADRIIIIQFMGITGVGIYSASYSLGQTLTLLYSPLGFVLFPLLSRLWDKGEAKEVGRYFVYATRYYLLVALPVCIGLALISQPVLHMLATVRFATDGSLVFWIALGITLKGLFLINVYIFHLVYKTKYSILISLLGAFLNLGLNLLFVPWIGLNGAALTTMITFLLMAVIALNYGQRLIGYRIKWLDIGKGVVAAVIMAICLYWLPVDNFWNILGVIPLGAGIYLVLLFLLRTFSKTELSQIRRLLVSYLPA